MSLFPLVGCADSEEETSHEDSAFKIMMDQQVSETIYSKAALYDLNLVAESRGWTLEDAKAQRMATVLLKDSARELRELIGDEYIGAVLSDIPGENPTIYITGDTEAVQDIVPEGVQIIGNRDYSLKELKRSQKQLHGILTNFEYEEIATSIDIATGKINVNVLRLEDPRLTILILPGSVTDRLPESLKSLVSVTIETESFVDLYASYGGIDIRNSAGTCTTGWVVEDNSGNTGVTTAAHCTGMAEIEHWGNFTHDITLEGSHFGPKGDISWYSTDTNDDLAYFYFNHLNQVREVNAVETIADMVVGETVCIYGRVTNQRDCSLEIESTSVTCTYLQGTVENMIGMDGNAATNGDSGGGWSYGNTAYGSLTGICNNKNIFSPADNFDDAIGVTVLTQ